MRVIYGGVHFVTVPGGSTQPVEVKIRPASDAASSQVGRITLLAVSQGDLSQGDSIDVMLVIE
jgi:hypothetical protein